LHLQLEFVFSALKNACLWGASLGVFTINPGLPLFLEIWKQGNVREFSNGQGNGKKTGKNQGEVRDFFLSGKNVFKHIKK
jgi:hypothetical protein